MKKISKENKKEIIKLRKEGMSLESIAKKFNVCITTIFYHLNKNYFKKYQKKRTEYYNKRYKTDEEFRIKTINRVKEARKK